MKYIQTNGDMFHKYQTLYDLLQDQVSALENIIKLALHRYDIDGDNVPMLIEGFFTIIEAIEKTVDAQQIISGEKIPGLPRYITRLKTGFRENDIAAIREATESRQTTIH